MRPTVRSKVHRLVTTNQQTLDAEGVFHCDLDGCAGYANYEDTAVAAGDVLTHWCAKPVRCIARGPRARWLVAATTQVCLRSQGLPATAPRLAEGEMLFDRVEGLDV